MDAVSKGKLNKVDIIVSSVLNHGTEDRVDDNLRNRKNYLIILYYLEKTFIFIFFNIY